MIEDGKESGGFEYVSALNFESSFKKFRSYIEKSSMLHYEFWNHLLEESPELGRLNDLGIRIDYLNKKIEFFWK